MQTISKLRLERVRQIVEPIVLMAAAVFRRDCG
jgi:hypothetical protein